MLTSASIFASSLFSLWTLCLHWPTSDLSKSRSYLLPVEQAEFTKRMKKKLGTNIEKFREIKSHMLVKELQISKYAIQTKKGQISSTISSFF